MPNKLNPCPFCGDENTDTWDKIGANGRTVFSAYCEECKCEGPISSTKEEAIEAWNRRAEEE